MGRIIWSLFSATFIIIPIWRGQHYFYQDPYTIMLILYGPYNSAPWSQFSKIFEGCLFWHTLLLLTCKMRAIEHWMAINLHSFLTCLLIIQYLFLFVHGIKTKFQDNNIIMNMKHILYTFFLAGTFSIFSTLLLSSIKFLSVLKIGSKSMGITDTKMK